MNLCYKEVVAEVASKAEFIGVGEANLSDSAHSDKALGWETLFQHGAFPPRFQTLAPPNDTVVEWAADLAEDSRILDIGCGVGRHVVYLGRRGFRMAGVDVSPLGVQRTQEACAEYQIEFDGRVSEMTSLPWDASSFDAVLSTSTMSHNLWADLQRAVMEVWRVLKPGGLFLVDFIHKDTLSYQRVREQAASGTISEVEPETFVDESEKPDVMDDAFLPHHYSDEAEIRDLLCSFDILKLWEDLPSRTLEGGLPQRGYWVAWARKPAFD
jgi:SAM-dependent methyltransferase